MQRQQNPRSKEREDTGWRWVLRGVRPHTPPDPGGRPQPQTARGHSAIEEEGRLLTHVAPTPEPGDVPRKQDPKLSQADPRRLTKYERNRQQPVRRTTHGGRGACGPGRKGWRPRLRTGRRNSPCKRKLEKNSESLSRGAVKASDETQHPTVTRAPRKFGTGENPLDRLKASV